MSTTEPASAASRESTFLSIEQGVVELYRAVNDVAKKLAIQFDPDLQPAGFGILRYIRTREPIRAAEIVSALGMDKSAVSRQVTQLRELGLVDTTPDPEDRRASLLVLTERSRAELRAIREQSAADYQRVLADWTDDELATFASMLRRFSAAR